MPTASITSLPSSPAAPTSEPRAFQSYGKIEVNGKTLHVVLKVKQNPSPLQETTELRFGDRAPTPFQQTLRLTEKTWKEIEGVVTDIARAKGIHTKVGTLKAITATGINLDKQETISHTSDRQTNTHESYQLIQNIVRRALAKVPNEACAPLVSEESKSRLGIEKCYQDGRQEQFNEFKKIQKDLNDRFQQENLKALYNQRLTDLAVHEEDQRVDIEVSEFEEFEAVLHTMALRNIEVLAEQGRTALREDRRKEMKLLKAYFKATTQSIACQNVETVKRSGLIEGEAIEGSTLYLKLIKKQAKGHRQAILQEEELAYKNLCDAHIAQESLILENAARKKEQVFRQQAHELSQSEKDARQQIMNEEQSEANQLKFIQEESLARQTLYSDEKFAYQDFSSSMGISQETLRNRLLLREQKSIQELAQSTAEKRAKLAAKLKEREERLKNVP